MRILITGMAGFIGSHLAARFQADGHEILGIDSLNDYYDPRWKTARLARLGILPDPSWLTEEAIPRSGSLSGTTLSLLLPPPSHPLLSQNPRPSLSYCDEAEADIASPKSEAFPIRFIRADISDAPSLERIWTDFQPEICINLAAQAGVRYSLENPRAYIDSNLMGFVNILECCRRHPAVTLLFASSSSVYGDNEKIPFSESDRTDSQVSIYAATKKCNETLAATYSRLFSINTIGLRFFTVYGPWGRPDMAPVLFADAILSGRPIRLFNGGRMSRDFTHISDITAGIAAIVDSLSYPAASSPSSAVLRAMPEKESHPDADASAKFKIFNIGRGNPEPLSDFIALLERNLGRKAILEPVDMQPGDVERTWADTTRLRDAYGYSPRVSLAEGIADFARWRLSLSPDIR